MQWHEWREKRTLPIPKKIWTDIRYFIAFGLGSGALPAPGTMGTLAALPFYFAARSLPLTYYLILLTLATIASIWLLDRISKEMAIHDHPGMCLDEFIGVWVALIPAHTPAAIVSAVVLFRFFDIIKPWPISYVDQHVHGGFGMILDDVIAGLATAACIVLFNCFY